MQKPRSIIDADLMSAETAPPWFWYLYGGVAFAIVIMIVGIPLWLVLL